jgi:hypothetical protein
MIMTVANAADLMLLFAFMMHLLFLCRILRGHFFSFVSEPFEPLRWVIAIPSLTGHDDGVVFVQLCGQSGRSRARGIRIGAPRHRPGRLPY